MNLLLKYGIVAFAILVLSCERDNHLTLHLEKTGYLTVNVVDKEQNPLPGATLEVLSTNPVFYGETDTSGSFENIELLEGGYACKVLYSKNDINYWAWENVQVTAGNTYEIIVRPYKHVGTIVLKFTDLDGNPLKGYKVECYSTELYDWENVYEAKMDFSFVQYTDENGNANFKNVPCASYKTKSMRYVPIITDPISGFKSTMMTIYCIKNEIIYQDFKIDIPKN